MKFFEFLQEKKIEAVVHNINPQVLEKGCDVGILFPLEDIHTTEEVLKEIRHNYKTLKILPVINKKNYNILEMMYSIDIERICFETDFETIFSELNRFYDLSHLPKTGNTENHYIIQFFENKNVFFVDLSGELKKEKLTPLKLMFSSYLSVKLNKLKAVIFIFNDIAEDSATFITLWTLFRFWKIIGFDYGKIYFLSSSETLIRRINKYISHLGVKNYPNLIEISKDLFPDIAKLGEKALFELSSQLLEVNNKNVVN